MSSNITELTNPFVGLRAFEEHEDYLFFGRGKQTNELLQRLGNNRFLAIIGSSGSGKSSLVKSGLLPAVYGGFMKAGSNWRVAVIKPGENPIGYLSKALAKDQTLYNHAPDDDTPYEAIIESSIKRSENGLVQVYQDAHLAPDENLLIVVDQFEELFRFSRYEKENNFGQSDAMHFIQVLLTATQHKECPIYVILTMRSDFLGDCAEFRGLPEAINNGQYLVPRMLRNEIREAITGPVAVSTATISQRLVTRLLNDINNDTDQLPLLQHAMMRTWDAWQNRNQPDTPIDFEDYEKIGTMKAALSLHAEEAYAELSTEKEQQVCELMFKALTDKSADVRGIRRPRSIVDLCLLAGGTQAEIKEEVEIFRKPGRTFLMPPVDVPLTDDTIVDISHESLMRIWVRLVKWTEEEARSGDLYMRLANSAQLRESGQRGLLKDPELTISLQWKEKNMPTAKWAEGFKADYALTMAYLEESRRADIEEKRVLERKESTRKRLVKTVFALLGILVVAGIVAASILYSSQQDALSAKNDAVMEREAALKAKRKADALRVEAELAKADALISGQKADSARIEANASAAQAVREREAATAARDTAKKNAALATAATLKANQERGIAEGLQKEAQRQAYKNAPSEYARLIREGPTDKKGILAEAFDYKLVAYTNHLDSLGGLIETTEDKGAMEKYNNLVKRLYYNNDLYEKIYSCFEYTTNGKDAIFKPVKQPTNTVYRGDLDLNNDNFKAVNNTLTLAGKQVIKIIEDKKDQRVICSTNDNLVYIFSTAQNEVAQEDAIPMGGKVTALDYNSENNIIYFGLESGNIGFVRYSKEKKNQPVFENALGTPITAVQLFETSVTGENKYFLLAAGKKSKVVVYALDDNEPVPDKRLLGNILPEKNLGDVTNAVYDEKTKSILIRVESSRNTNQSTFQWNPFTASALKEYKELKGDGKHFPSTKLY